jgi:hypothetical protein
LTAREECPRFAAHQLHAAVSERGATALIARIAFEREVGVKDDYIAAAR